MCEKRSVVGVLQGCQAEKSCVIVQITENPRLAQRLRRVATNPTNPDQRHCPCGIGAAHFLGREVKYRLEQSDARIPYRELRGMHANRETSRTGLNIVTSERALSPFVEVTRSIQGKRMSRNHQPRVQRMPNLRIDPVAHSWCLRCIE